MNRSFLFCVAAMLAVVLLFFYAIEYVPLCRKAAREKYRERIQTVQLMAARPLVRALDTHDDLTIVSQIESIAKAEDVTAAFILNSSGTVIAHNQTTEWGKNVTDAYFRAGVGVQRIQKTLDGYLFSLPLNAHATLFIAVSDKSLHIKDIASATYALIVAVIVFVILMSSMILYFEKCVAVPMRTVQDALRSEAGYHAPEGLHGEWKALSDGIADALRRHAAPRGGAQMKEGSVDGVLLVRALDSCRTGMLVLDARNRVIAVNEAFRALPGFRECVAGTHILDIHADPAIFKLIQHAASSPDTEVAGTVAAVSLRALSVSVEGVLVGTVVAVH